MKKLISAQMSKAMLFAFPCYWTFALLFIAVVLWKTRPSHPDVIATALVSIANIVAGILLARKCYWISIPMIVLGAYIALSLHDEQFMGHIFLMYGEYLILHYLVCGVYVYRRRKEA